MIIPETFRRRKIKLAKKHVPELESIAKNQSNKFFLGGLAKTPERVQLTILQDLYRELPNTYDLITVLHRILNVPWLSAESVEGKEAFVRSIVLDYWDRKKALSEFNSRWTGDETTRGQWRYLIGSVGGVFYSIHRCAGIAVDKHREDTGEYDEQFGALVSKAADLATKNSRICLEYELFRRASWPENPWERLLTLYESGLLLTKGQEKIHVVSQKGLERL